MTGTLMKKRKPSLSEQKSGRTVVKFRGKEYDEVTTEKMGADGVVETHVDYVPGKGRYYGIPAKPVLKNVMSNEDRRRLGLEIDESVNG